MLKGQRRRARNSGTINLSFQESFWRSLFPSYSGRRKSCFEANWFILKVKAELDQWHTTLDIRQGPFYSSDSSRPDPPLQYTTMPWPQVHAGNAVHTMSHLCISPWDWILWFFSVQPSTVGLLLSLQSGMMGGHQQRIHSLQRRCLTC